MLRAHLKPAWDMVNRWEELQPVCHRTPLPEALLRAMVGLALALRWTRWACVTLACFYAVARPGEMLKARRCDVLTPEDLLDLEHPWLYIRVGKPKSKRKAAKIQHVKLQEPGAVQFLQRLWRGLVPAEQLYPGSPAVYRRRWDRILQLLEVPSHVRLTPASLRAGGAISAFQKGTAIVDLMWRMRIKSQSTLEHYLQEMMAVSLLPTLSGKVRQRIRAAGCLYAVAVKGDT